MEDVSKLSDEELQKMIDAASVKRAERVASAKAAIQRKEREERLKLAELEDQHGPLDVDIAAVFSPNTGNMVVVRKAKPITYNKFQNRVTSAKGASDAEITEFAYSNLLYPSKAEFETICEGCAEIRAAAVAVACRLAGAGRVELEGK
jgi:hypothetical protein